MQSGIARFECMSIYVFMVHAVAEVMSESELVMGLMKTYSFR